jgi:hypothetical protein
MEAFQKAMSIDNFIRKQKFSTDLGSRHADNFTQRRACERTMPIRALPPRELGALVRFDVRSQSFARQHRGHRLQITIECNAIDAQCGSPPY